MLRSLGAGRLYPSLSPGNHTPKKHLWDERTAEVPFPYINTSMHRKQQQETSEKLSMSQHTW